MWGNFGEVLRPASLPPGNSPPPLTPRPGGKGAVSLFTREDYLEVRRGSPEEDFSAKLCKSVTFFEEKDKVRNSKVWRDIFSTCDFFFFPCAGPAPLHPVHAPKEQEHIPK